MGFLPLRKNKKMRGERIAGIVMITFEEVELRGPDLKDLESLQQHISEAEVNPLLASAHYLISCFGCEEYLRRKKENAKNRSGYLFAIYVDGEGPLGLAELGRIDWRSRHSEISVWVMRGFQDKGYEKKAAVALLHFAFAELGLHRVYGRAAEDDAPLIQLYQKDLIFTPEGAYRDHLFHEGKYLNVITFGLLDIEYLEKFGKMEVKIKAQKPKGKGQPSRMEFKEGSKEPVFF